MPPLIRRFIIFFILGGLAIFLLNSLTSVSSATTWRPSYSSALSFLSPGKSTTSPTSEDKSHAQDQSDSKPGPVYPSRPWEQPSGSFKWHDVPLHYPIAVKDQIPLPTGPIQPIPRIERDFSLIAESPAQKEERERRLEVVLEAFKHSWSGYKSKAWLHDEIQPLSGGFADPFGGWGATLVDSLDTLWIMGLHDEFREAVAALDQIDFSSCPLDRISVFETTIRYLGGFLSAYELSKSQFPTLLQKAIELGDMLYKAFDTPNRMPIPRWDWMEALKGKAQKAVADTIIAEPASLSLEFTKLSQLTEDNKYYDAVARIANIMEKEQNRTRLPGLWPLSVNLRTDDWHKDSKFLLGGMSDSAYEYLPKQYLLLGGRDERFRSMYLNALNATKRYLAFEPLVPSEYSDPSPLILGSASVDRGRVKLEGRGEHLTCFAGGMIALGARLSSDVQASTLTLEDLSVAARVSEGCVWSYFATSTGVGPEIFMAEPCRIGRDAVTSGLEADHHGVRGNCSYSREHWLSSILDKPSDDPAELALFVASHNLPEGMLKMVDSQYQLRPEAIESLFVLYRITGDRRYQEQAWKMFEAINKWCRTPLAYAVMPDVKVVVSPPEAVNKAEHSDREHISLRDKMESFWTAETLKYFYLIFSDPLGADGRTGLPGGLDEWVFNTEAHPLRWRTAPDVPSSQ